MANPTNSVLLSTAYLPPVSYFYFLLKSELAVIEQWETYPKQTFRNRCVIYSERGKLPLTIPVRKPNGNQTRTSEIEILNFEKWQTNHWRAIASAYASSPFFLYYRDELEDFYSDTFDNLIEFNLKITKVLMEIIGIDARIVFTDTFEKLPEGIQDLRFSISPKNQADLLKFPAYTQVFSEKHGFIQNLSIIDLLFNLGPETKDYLESLVEISPNH